ncbi:GNAT family N-acetyltransferase [Rathayibacter sp. VKM Ac-2803]|uniref:GNAT family N-acetyltransferase n=1 Tax=unclassified Rathayibacter TaxID=2609250 RepID=UPI0013580361|nr:MULTISPECIES: GNAT family protein [unclassified Rathayibacter]MWV49815.1 GNAT family N-acetyltransferase [Rathayibacter sp. VKM Ac-2803]MWV57946.1 GNAT family N-acetyltransferase [Rathayibacter sp. VKM Ac-2754]
MSDPSDVWPLFSLVLRTPRLELHPVRDSDLSGLAAAASAGIHEAGRSPFPSPWAEAPPERLPADLARYHWSLRAATTADSWRVAFAILEGGVVVGCQDLLAEGFAATRTVSSGSWLTRSAQGRGLGREMRAAVLALAFDHLGAEVAESSALAWNTASIGVSTALGYRPNGTQRTIGADGVAVEESRFRVTPEAFRRPDWPLEVEGIESARAVLLAPPA